MTHLSAKNGWLCWRGDTAYGEEGRARISAVTAVFHADGDSYVTVHSDANSWLINDVTVDEVMTAIRGQDGEDRDLIDVVAQQATYIEKLEKELAESTEPDG